MGTEEQDPADGRKLHITSVHIHVHLYMYVYVYKYQELSHFVMYMYMYKVNESTRAVHVHVPNMQGSPHNKAMCACEHSLCSILVLMQNQHVK